MDLLEWVQQRAVKIFKGLEHLTYKERLRQLGPLNSEKTPGNLITIYRCVMGESNKMEGGPFQWCLVTIQGSMDTSWNTRNHLNTKKTWAMCSSWHCFECWAWASLEVLSWLHSFAILWTTLQHQGIWIFLSLLILLYLFHINKSIMHWINQAGIFSWCCIWKQP